MTTFATIKTRIADEMNRSDLTSQIQLEVLTAVKHYARDRMWFAVARETAVTVANQVNLAVPTDLIEIELLDITASGATTPLMRVDWETFRGMGGADAATSAATPDCYAYYADQLWFFPRPDAAYPLTMSLVKVLTALSADADTDSWMTHGEEMIRARAKAAVEIRYLKDPDAVAEKRMMMQMGRPYLCGEEEIAHKSLLRFSRKRMSTGRLVTDIGASGGFNIYTGR